MRRLVPLALFLVVAAACDKAPPGPGDGSTAASAEAFDPNSADNTLAWAVGLYAKKEAAPSGSQAARMDALKAYAEEIGRQTKGRSVRWPVTVEKIDGDGRVRLRPIEREDRRAGADRPVRFAFEVRSTNGNAQRGSDDVVLFSSVPPNADWLKKFGFGDPVLLVGQIDSGGGVSLEKHRGETIGVVSFMLTEAHVEKP